MLIRCGMLPGSFAVVGRCSDELESPQTARTWSLPLRGVLVALSKGCYHGSWESRIDKKVFRTI